MAATSSAARPKKTLAVPPWMTTCWCGKPARMKSRAAGTLHSPVWCVKRLAGGGGWTGLPCLLKTGPS